MPFLAGQILEADDLNRVGCTLRRAATQTANDATLTTISWDTEVEDTDGLWAAGSPTVVTLPSTELWAITLEVQRAAAVTAFSFMQIVPSASVFTTAMGALRFPFNIGESIATASCTIPLSSGTTFTTQVNLDGAGNSTITAVLTCYRTVGGA